jgi:hypothetical protein
MAIAGDSVTVVPYLVAVVVKLVVAGECQQGSKSWTQGEEDLSCCCYPDLKQFFFKFNARKIIFSHCNLYL